MTKHRLKTSPFWAIAVVAALGMGLSACGGGSDGLSAAQQQAVDDAAKIQADKDAAQAAYDTAKMAIAEADTAAAAQAALDDVKDMITGMQIDELQAMVDDRIAAIGMADSVTMQKDALMAAAGMLDTSDLSAPGAIAAANTAIGALEMALDDATDVSDADKTMYQTQLDTAKGTVAVATHRMAIDDAADMALTYVSAVTDTSTDGEVASAQQAVQAVRDAITAADGVLSEGDKSIVAAEAQLELLDFALDDAIDSRMTAMTKANEDRAKENAALGKAMHAALGKAGDNMNALNNITTSGVSLAPTELTVTRAQNAGSITAETSVPTGVMLKAGASVAPLGSWNGMDYAADPTGTGDDKYVADMARVYTNQGPGKSVAFDKANHGLGAVSDGSDGSNGPKGYYAINADDWAKMMSPAFEHSAKQEHEPEERQDAVYVRGTFDGAPGQFRCSGADTCSSTNDGKGSPSSLTGTWHFKPDEGAMLSQPDSNYLYYGWWVRKDAKGMPVAASAFASAEGEEAVTGDNQPESLEGSATYAGHAVGKFAINNPFDGTGSGGHFTADAELNATFGGGTPAPTNPGMTGTIDNFRLNDGTDDPGWSVELKRAMWDTGNDGEFKTDTMGTVWSINGNKASASGNWNGTMYDDADDDGSNLPTTVVGEFYSESGTIGRMVGAFGANKQ